MKCLESAERGWNSYFKINSTKRRQFIVGFIPVFRSQSWLTRELPEPPLTGILH